MADNERSRPPWLVSSLIALLAAGGGIVALLNYFSEPRIEKFDVAPQEIRAGAKATLDWSTAQATSVEITPGVGVVGLSGTRDVGPSSTTVYQLVARNNWRTQVATREVVVLPSAEAKVVLHNESQATVAHVYFGCAKWGGWSGEQLSDVIPPRSTYVWEKLEPGAGIYDLRAEDADHRVLNLETGVSIAGSYDWYVRDKE